MRKWDPLNSAQHELLKRVGAGADLSAADDVPYRTSAYALSNRGLVTVSKRGGLFRTLITDAGRFYLEHGHHPDRPAPVPRTRRASGQRPATTAASHQHAAAPSPLKPTQEASVDGTAAKRVNARSVAAITAARDMLERITACGGVLRFENVDAGTRSAHIKAVTRANSAGLVPAGHHLRHSTRSSGEFVVVLVDAAQPDTLSWNPPPRGRATGAVGAVAATMRDHPTVFDVSEAARPRALEILQALADEAQARGHRLSVPRRRKHPRPLLDVNHYQCELHLVEEKDRVPHSATADERRRSRYGWNPAPEFDRVPSGRLRLEARLMYHSDAVHRWADTTRDPLEKQIRKIFTDLESEAEVRRQQNIAWRKEYEEQQERERREQAVRQTQWEEAMRRAHKAAIATYRRRTFATALDDWNTALEIRALCDALEEAATRTDEKRHAEGLRRWVVWGRNQADRLDPTTPTGLAHTPFDYEPGVDDLRPHLGEWSPFSAEREHRYEPRVRETNEPAPTENWFARRARQWWRR